jgi:hypothetical protein
MNYATWKLNFSDPEYGTGPEYKVIEMGFVVEPVLIDGSAEDGGTIIGYASAKLDEIELEAWQFQNITAEEALDFCQVVNENAYLTEEGRLAVPQEVRTI